MHLDYDPYSNYLKCSTSFESLETVAEMKMNFAEHVHHLKLIWIKKAQQYYLKFAFRTHDNPCFEFI